MQPAADEEAVWPVPVWPTRSAADVRMDPARLAAMADHVGGRGCVTRHGYLVHSWGDVNRPGDVASAAKAVYAHFALRAVEEGRLRSLDAPVVEVEPRLGALNPDLDHKDGRMTWRHMLNQIACYGVREEPGTAFDYNDWHMALLWDTLFLKVYGATLGNVDDRVLRPLLTDLIGCEDLPTFLAFGPDDRPGRLGISPRDFARFGLLYLRGGCWQGQQLISPELAALATHSPLPNDIPRTSAVAADLLPGQRTIGSQVLPDNQTDHLGSYSFLWWTNGVDRDGVRHWRSAPEDVFGAFGLGGRCVSVVMPGLDVVVSWNESTIDSREGQDRALGLLAKACLDRGWTSGRAAADP